MTCATSRQRADLAFVIGGWLAGGLLSTLLDREAVVPGMTHRLARKPRSSRPSPWTPSARETPTTASLGE